MFSPIELALLIAFVLCFAVQMGYYLYFYIGVVSRNNGIKKGVQRLSETQPPVSVIICAKNEEDNLRAFLPKVFEQDYPCFEVVVVNDASDDNTSMVLAEFLETYTNLYVTNIPQGTNVLSPKKLAVTVGVKASRYEHLLFTDADCYPVSKSWISNMVKGISSDTEFVIGYGDYEQGKGLLNRLISYDTLFIAMQYFGFAYRGKPYMAIGRNLLYLKSTFYKNKGFAGHLHIVSGDDDLLINKSGNAKNTTIICHEDSKTISLPEINFTKWLDQKRRHLSASSLYTSSSRNMIGAEVLSRGGFYATALSLMLVGSLLSMILVGLMFLLRYVVQTLIINATAKELGSRKHFVGILFFDIFLPLISLSLLFENRMFGVKKRK